MFRVLRSLTLVALIILCLHIMPVMASPFEHISGPRQWERQTWSTSPLNPPDSGSGQEPPAQDTSEGGANDNTGSQPTDGNGNSDSSGGEAPSSTSGNSENGEVDAGSGNDNEGSAPTEDGSGETTGESENQEDSGGADAPEAVDETPSEGGPEEENTPEPSGDSTTEDTSSSEDEPETDGSAGETEIATDGDSSDGDNGDVESPGDGDSTGNDGNAATSEENGETAENSDSEPGTSDDNNENNGEMNDETDDAESSNDEGTSTNVEEDDNSSETGEEPITPSDEENGTESNKDGDSDGNEEGGENSSTDEENRSEGDSINDDGEVEANDDGGTGETSEDTASSEENEGEENEGEESDPEDGDGTAILPTLPVTATATVVATETLTGTVTVATATPTPTQMPTRRPHVPPRATPTPVWKPPVPTATPTVTPTPTRPIPRQHRGILRIDPYLVERVLGDRFSETIYAYTENGWLYRSVDNGRIWRLRTTAASVEHFVMNRYLPDVLYSSEDLVCNEIGSVEADFGDLPIYKSTDGGTNWFKLPAEQNLQPLLSHTEDSDIVFAAGCDGLYLSRDGGQTWSIPDNSGADSLWRTYRVVAMADVQSEGNASRNRFNAIYAVGLDIEGRSVVAFSDDMGASWTQLTPLVAPAPQGFGAFAVDPFVEGRVWLADTNGVWHTEDFGMTWAFSAHGLESMVGRGTADAPFGLNTLNVHPNGQLYVGAGRGLYTKSDAGTKWDKVTDNIFDLVQIHDLFFTETRPDLLYLNAEGEVYIYRVASR